jgi:hypothetical protein
MVTNDPPQKRNILTIRLTQPAVFLNAGDTNTSSRLGRPAMRESGPPCMLRGLLTLNLAKTTRISSIEIELEGSLSR